MVNKISYGEKKDSTSEENLKDDKDCDAAVI